MRPPAIVCSSGSDCVLSRKNLNRSRARSKGLAIRPPVTIHLKFEGGSYTEMAAAAADGPEQIGLFFFARAHYLALSGDKFDGPEVVEGEAIFAHQPAQSATQREPGDTRTRNDPARDRETV